MLTRQQLPLESECDPARLARHQGCVISRRPQLSVVWLTLAAAVERAGIQPEDVEEVFVGNVLSAK